MKQEVIHSITYKNGNFAHQMTGRPMILWMYIGVANNIITLEGRRNGNTGIFAGSNGKGSI